MEKLGIENTEKFAEALAVVAKAAKKISADGKVDVNDLSHAMELLIKAPALIEGFSAIKKVIDEGKDLDSAEIVALVKLVDSKIKEIEKA